MRQQLRLRVILPVAVLGLLGAGFGAFAMGSPVDPAAGTPAPPPATTTTAAPAPKPAKPAAPGAVPAATWVQQANVLCTEFNAKTVKPARTPEAAEALLAQGVKVTGQFVAHFRELGWPQGEKSAVFTLRADLATSAGYVSGSLAAFRARDLQKILRLADLDAALVKSWNEEVRRLGAGQCVVDTSPKNRDAVRQTNRPLTGAEAVEWALYFDRAVVVVFYTPDSVLDKRAVLDARSAAIETDAGFLAVNVKREAQVAALAIGYEVLEAPTVLVLVRGPKLRFRFDGFVDRQTVAQAISNARR